MIDKRVIKFIDSFPCDVKVTQHAENMRLTRDQFERKMLEEHDGLRLLVLCQQINSGLDQRGLCFASRKGGTVYFDVPSWPELVSFLRGIVAPGQIG
jgi:hypothetical protein